MTAVAPAPVVRGDLRLNEPMAQHNSWRAGGVADRFFLPADLADLIEFLKTLPQDEPLFWVGLGSNLLVRDGGVRGTVICTRNRLKVMALQEHKRELFSQVVDGGDAAIAGALRAEDFRALLE